MVEQCTPPLAHPPSTSTISNNSIEVEHKAGRVFFFLIMKAITSRLGCQWKRHFCFPSSFVVKLGKKKITSGRETVLRCLEPRTSFQSTSQILDLCPISWKTRSLDFPLGSRSCNPLRFRFSFLFFFPLEWQQKNEEEEIKEIRSHPTPSPFIQCGHSSKGKKRKKKRFIRFSFLSFFFFSLSLSLSLSVFVSRFPWKRARRRVHKGKSFLIGPIAYYCVFTEFRWVWLGFYGF